MDSNSPVSGNESMDDEDDAFVQEQIEGLEKKLQDSPFDYQAHVDRIALLRQCGEFGKLNCARQDMHAKFPLTQELWLEWLEDEQKFTESEEDHEKLAALFERATYDYLSPEIWLEYAQYSIRLIGKAEGIPQLRGVMERALSVVGLHVSKGSLVWEAYREIENAILTTLQPQPGSISTPEENDRIHEQMERVSKLFHRQLAVPLLDMETTMKEYEEWRTTCEDGEISPSVQQSYAESKKKLEDLASLENALDQADMPKLEQYQSYIDHEKKSGDPARVQCIYERAITDNCLNSQLWLQYLQYLTETLKTGPVVQSVHERAIRNCPWVAQLWQKYLICMERNRASVEQLEKVRGDAFEVGFSSAADYALLWQTCCDQARRYCCAADDNEKEAMRNFMHRTFENATSHLQNTVASAFRETGDPEYTLWCYWARCEAEYLGNVKKARGILEMLLKDATVRRKWSVWLEYFNLERFHGDAEQARSVLHQAVQSAAADDGSAESACFYLLRFEREHGSLADLDDAVRKTDARLAKVAKRKDKIASVSQADGKRHDNRDSGGDKQWKKGSKTNRSPRKRQTSHHDEAPKKRQKTEPIGAAEGPAEFKAPTGLPIRFVKKKPEVTKADEAAEPTRTAAPPGYKPDKGSRQAEPAPKPSAQDVPNLQAKIERAERTPDDPPHNEERTVFVSNLAYDMEDVEEKLRKTFGPCGTLEAVRIVRNNKGKFRGFAYVQFAEKSGVEEALKLDRQPLSGRPMFVSPNVDKSKNQEFKAFKYETRMERHKLFVSGLSFDTTQDKLEELFSVHGKLRSVRLVTMRNGRSKGWAYVEYENESDAAQAVVKTDQTVIDGFTIKVAISNPPARKKPVDDNRKQLQQRPPPGGRGRGRTQLSLIPRALQRSDAKTPPSAANGSRAATSEKPLSNKDFAQMFVKR